MGGPERTVKVRKVGTATFHKVEKGSGRLQKLKKSGTRSRVRAGQCEEVPLKMGNRDGGNPLVAF